MVYKQKDTARFEKKGVTMAVYNTKEQCPQASVVFQKTEKGHSEEFYHTKSYFIFYIIKGKGDWYIDEVRYGVKSGDVIIIPPNHKFYYKGSLEQICVTSPSWEPEYEHHVRDIEL
jgi:mannose-6-phosphate isomerase-like protein (cupin superfamily)